jgi:hypothetical protein
LRPPSDEGLVTRPASQSEGGESVRDIGRGAHEDGGHADGPDALDVGLGVVEEEGY